MLVCHSIPYAVRENKGHAIVSVKLKMKYIVLKSKFAKLRILSNVTDKNLNLNQIEC